jgi:Tfp pilus assembly protein PilO
MSSAPNGASVPSFTDRWLHAGLWKIDLVGLGAVAVITAAVWAIAISPRVDEDQSMRQRYAELVQAEREAEEAGMIARAAAARARQLQEELTRTGVVLSPRSQQIRVLAAISDLAQTNALDVQSVDTGTPRSTPQWVEVPITISGAGRYGDCVEFLAQLSAMRRDLLVRALSLEGDVSNPSPVARFRFEMIWFASESSATRTP